MLIENFNLKVIETFIYTKIEILMNLKPAHTSDHEDPKRDDDGKSFPLKKAV